jgi:hypothetical protein
MEQLAPPSLTPAFLKIVSIRHHLVKLDWSRLIPTNAVSKNQLSFTKWPNSTEIRIMLPAIIFIESLIFMYLVF